MTRTVTPPRIAFAVPTPTNHMPSVAMNDGILSPTWTRPFTKPSTAPSASTSNTPSRPKSLSFAPFSTTSDRITAPKATTPSMDRSMLPMMITKVTPSPRMSGIAAELATRTRLRTERKFGLMRPMMTHSATSTRSGA